MNIDRETGQALPPPRSPRFQLWVAFLVFSTITMFSAIGVKKDRGETDSNAKWAVTCSVLTCVATGVVVLLHLNTAFAVYIVDTKVEGVLTLVLASFWGSAVAVVSNATNGLAVNSELDNTIVNGNLYYFSCKSEVVQGWDSPIDVVLTFALGNNRYRTDRATGRGGFRYIRHVGDSVPASRLWCRLGRRNQESSSAFDGLVGSPCVSVGSPWLECQCVRHEMR